MLNILKFFSPRPKNIFLYALTNPMLPNNDPTLLNNDVWVFQINTTICTSMLPANFNEREERRTKQEPKATQRPSSIDENVFPDLLCGLVCFENCGLALTKNKHVVAWSLCKPAIEVIDEKIGDVETRVKQPSPPPKPTFTAGPIPSDQESMMATFERRKENETNQVTNHIFQV